MPRAEFEGFLSAEGIAGVDAIVFEKIEHPVVGLRLKDGDGKEGHVGVFIAAYPVSKESHGGMYVTLSPSCNFICENVGLPCRRRSNDYYVVMIGAFLCSLHIYPLKSYLALLDSCELFGIAFEHFIEFCLSARRDDRGDPDTRFLKYRNNGY